ncbi:MAG TPA: iron donor protein CyaY [Acidiferrobacteraceae bacterium]|nr:iron donor protein CyaY [Acidiferrobacteraceae bacterium]
MNDSEFHENVNQTMARIEAAIEAAVDSSGADIDYETVSEILTLEFENGNKIIINKQAAAHQIWVADKSGGFHFDYDEDRGQWLNDRSGAELLSELSRFASVQAGQAIDLKK